MFYTQKKETLFFASAIGSLFQYPGVDPVLDENGLCEIFALGPARTPGNGVFRDIYEVLPGHYLSFADGILKDHCYWNVKSQPHEDSREETVEKTAWLLEDSIKRQMESEETISTFLSGGVDSSLVTAVCADALREKGKGFRHFPLILRETGSIFRQMHFSRVRTGRGWSRWQHIAAVSIAIWSAAMKSWRNIFTKLWMQGVCRVWRMWSPLCCISALRCHSTARQL